MKQERELAKVKYSALHKDIRIQTVKKFKPLNNQEVLYDIMCNSHRGLIQRFSNMLQKLIENQRESWRTRQYISTHMTPRGLPTGKEGFGCEKDKKEVADLSIQLLIDVGFHERKSPRSHPSHHYFV